MSSRRSTAYRQAKQLDPTRLIHASDGGTPHAFTDVLSSGGAERARKPFLMHEYGAYCCSLPDFSLIPRLTGVIRPRTYERAAQYVDERRLHDVYPRLRESSLIMRRRCPEALLHGGRQVSGSNCGYSSGWVWISRTPRKLLGRRRVNSSFGNPKPHQRMACQIGTAPLSLADHGPN